MRRRGPLVPKGTRRLVAFAAFMVAWAVRSLWTVDVQSPFGALFGDFLGYYTRAEWLLRGETPGEPRVLVLWPYGTHVVVAAELFVFGKSHPNGLALLQGFVGAIPAACAPLLAARFTTSKVACVAVGVLVAFWHPLVVFSGIFSSEIWFTAAILLACLWLARASEGRGGVLAAGAAFAFAYVLRPQALATFLLILAGYALLRRVRGKIDMRRLAVFALPFALAVAGSAWRYHRLTHEWGLIASNGSLNRLLGETDVRRVDAEWTAPDGSRWTWWFQPPIGKALGTPESVRIEGFIGDGKILDELRIARTKNMPWTRRLLRMADNETYLFARNPIWPEGSIAKPIAWRRELLEGFAIATWPLIVLALFGLPRLRRHRAAAIPILANLATPIAIAVLYVPESRYRVPYDPLLIVLAVLAPGTLRRPRKPSKA